MEFRDVIRRRHMTRTFRPVPLPRDVLDRILDAGERAPSAGFTQGVTLLVLSDPSDVELFWTHVGPANPSPGGRWDRLRAAPVIILPLASRRAYMDRYGEADKAGDQVIGPEGWTVPYWEVDAAFATMALLLAATNEGVGALFFAISLSQPQLLAALGVPADAIPIGALALGLAAPDDRPSPSVKRGRRGDVVQWGRWGSTKTD
jgi:nitroreductase